MKIQEFIDLKIKEMETAGFREVEFLSAIDCTLTNSGTMESFLAFESDLDQECMPFLFHEKGVEKQVKGSKVRIHGIPKRKRKGIVEIFYVEILGDKPRKIDSQE